MSSPLPPRQSLIDFRDGLLSVKEFCERALAEIDQDATNRVPDPLEGVRLDSLQPLLRPSHFLTQRWLGQCVRADWQHVHEGIARWSSNFILTMRSRGLPLFVHSAFRTREEQESAFRKGNSRAIWPRAPHCQGKAVDIVHAIKGWDLSRDQWNTLGKIGKLLHEQMQLQLPAKERFGLTWGGDFKSFWDPAHWEVTNWRDDIRALPTGEPVRKMPAKIKAEGPQR